VHARRERALNAKAHRAVRFACALFRAAHVGTPARSRPRRPALTPLAARGLHRSLRGADARAFEMHANTMKTHAHARRERLVRSHAGRCALPARASRCAARALAAAPRLARRTVAACAALLLRDAHRAPLWPRRRPSERARRAAPLNAPPWRAGHGAAGAAAAGGGAAGGCARADGRHNYRQRHGHWHLALRRGREPGCARAACGPGEALAHARPALSCAVGFPPSRCALGHAHRRATLPTARAGVPVPPSRVARTRPYRRWLFAARRLRPAR
jgi:hypothetical protein